jgi:nucleotide-binding universal stress UspA family protein
VSGTIVVGVDGSPASTEAARWAVEEARLRDARVQAVFAWEAPLAVEAPEPAVLGYPVVPEAPLEDVRAAFEERGRGVIEDAFAGVQGVEVEPLVVDADPGTALVDLSRDADLLVVGARHRGGIVGFLLGSVSRYCTQHAACPVVVVPAPGDSP